VVSLRQIVEKGRHRIAATQNEILATGSWLTAEEINARQHMSPADKSQPAKEWVKRRQIFCLVFDGAEYFAAYQFDGLCKPLPIIRDVLAVFGSRHDAWVVAAWFHFPNGWIVGDCERMPVAPMHAIDRPFDVVRAVQFMHGDYVG
jgi:hypothetical protein